MTHVLRKLTVRRSSSGLLYGLRFGFRFFLHVGLSRFLTFKQSKNVSNVWTRSFPKFRHHQEHINITSFSRMRVDLDDVCVVQNALFELITCVYIMLLYTCFLSSDIGSEPVSGGWGRGQGVGWCCGGTG